MAIGTTSTGKILCQWTIAEGIPLNVIRSGSEKTRSKCKRLGSAINGLILIRDKDK